MATKPKRLTEQHYIEEADVGRNTFIVENLDVILQFAGVDDRTRNRVLSLVALMKKLP